MTKIFLSIVVKRKMYVEFGIQKPDVYRIRDAFQGFCEISMAVNEQQTEGPSKTTEKKIDEVHDICENVPFSSVRVVATACFIL